MERNTLVSEELIKILARQAQVIISNIDEQQEQRQDQLLINKLKLFKVEMRLKDK